jgi:hypothetical protein
MQIDTEHLHHWMRAIRQSKDPMRTLDAFWRGQIKSKEWLIEALQLNFSVKDEPVSIDIHGGWVGTLASMLFQSTIPIKHIHSIDIDPECEEVATNMNQIELEAGKFRAVTNDMCKFTSKADVVINTSFEHITQEAYDLWLSRLPKNSLIVLQSNDYQIPDHIRTASNLEEFKKQSKLENILYEGKLELPLYNRFMLIGKRHV